MPRRPRNRKTPTGVNLPGVMLPGKIVKNKYHFVREGDEFVVDLRKEKKPKVRVIE